MIAEGKRCSRLLVWAILRKHARGMTASKVEETYGIRPYTLYRWKGMDA